MNNGCLIFADISNTRYAPIGRGVYEGERRAVRYGRDTQPLRAPRQSSAYRKRESRASWRGAADFAPPCATLAGQRYQKAA